MSEFDFISQKTEYENKQQGTFYDPGCYDCSNLRGALSGI